MIVLHGSGKTTLASYLMARWLAAYQCGSPALGAMGGGLQGTIAARAPLPQRSMHININDLIKLNKSQPVVCDGFPSSVDHLALLPQGSTVVLVECKEGLRESRLEERAALTRRAWTPGMASQRDELVLGVFEQVAAHGHKAVVLDNSGPLLTAAQIFLKISAPS